MAKILVLDNYDSFTYNLVHCLDGEGSHQVSVVRNDEVDLETVAGYDGVVLSPGPGIPSEAGQLLQLVDKYKGSTRIFGVCLGLQAIAEVFGGKLLNLSEVFHGVSCPVRLTGPGHYLFSGMASGFMAGRYHSWVAERESLPGELRVDAVDDHGYIMAISHVQYDICGVQFHPESILTPDGKKMITNWLNQF
jgi:anthranilate synthase component II